MSRMRSTSPAVTHVDGTARVQTVTREDNDVFYELIDAFHQLTGVPCILNTSFNDAGEPIVETPEDALICFLNTEIDHLVIGRHAIDASSVDKTGKVARVSGERRDRLATRRRELIDRLFQGYDEGEREFFVAESNKMSEWHAKYRSKYELEKKVMEWLRIGARILVVGTREHTLVLPEVVNDFGRVDVVGFCCYDRPVENTIAGWPAYPVVSWSDIAITEFDEILVSSFEYNFEIADRLASEVAGPVYAIYDNASRSFLDVLRQLPKYPYTGGGAGG